jgi:hypothetical protein
MNKMPGMMSHAIHSLTNNTNLPELAKIGPDRIGHRKYGHDIVQSSLLALATYWREIAMNVTKNQKSLTMRMNTS